MRIFAASLVLAVLAVALLAGCSPVDEKPAILLTDNEGVVGTRTVTVGYVNERLERVPAEMIPDIPGDEGKRKFMEEIIRKELLVIYGTRIGALEDPRYEGALEYFTGNKAEEMLREELIVGPAQVTPEEVADYYAVREDLFQLQEIVVPTEELANDAYRRVTEGGEDFGRVAQEVSTGATAQDEGRKNVVAWSDLHPLTRVEVRDLDKDDITPPHKIGGTWFIYKVLSRKDPPNQKPLEGDHLTGISAEARNFKRNLLEFHLFKEWDDSANIQFVDEAIDICGTRTDEEALRVIPQGDATTMDERMERARIAVVPQFTEEEANMVLVTYNIFGDEKTVTLGDYARMMSEIPGIETVKAGDRNRIESFIRRKVQEESIQAKIEEKGYKNSKEMKDYLEQRTEEFIIDITYDREVVQKVQEPTGQEIRDFYRSNLEMFVEPEGVDVQQIIVGTEAQANLVLQRIRSGETTFLDAVHRHSIDEWSKAKDGKIEKYRKGEGRLDYLQPVVFDKEIGDIVGPVRAPGGYALVKILAKYPERQMKFEEVGDVVRQSVINLKREELLTAVLDSARESVTIEFVDKNFQYIKDPAEVLKEKLANPSGTQTISIPIN